MSRKQLFKPEPKNPSYYTRQGFKFTLRIGFAVLFFVLGFNFSSSAFFKENPIFGVSYLAEIVISLLAGLIGFMYFHIWIRRTQYWLETLVVKTITEIVSNFWEQQSSRIQSARREKQKKNSQESEKKLKDKMLSAVLLDTSVLVDGRILDIVKTGFMTNTFIVPKYVINELHLISDNPDSQKRQRGRRGLDILAELKKYTKISIIDLPATDGGVDKSLIETAKKYKSKLMTLDFNLNKVAKVSGVSILNINELSNALKSVLLPGETFTTKIIQEGKEKEQGVGYLEDGTMIVVEDARGLVGQEVKVKVSRLIQSNAGKMIFCVLEK